MLVETADYQALLRGILESPQDDAPRLVMADWLEEYSCPERAEFIRVQCELARICKHFTLKQWEKYEATVLALRRRERELLETMLDTSTPTQRARTRASVVWAMPVLGRHVHVWPHTFHRGFIDSVSLSTAAFCGGPCERCHSQTHVPRNTGRGVVATSPCPACLVDGKPTGRTPGIARQLFEAAPITAVTLADAEPWGYPLGGGTVYRSQEDDGSDGPDEPGGTPSSTRGFLPKVLFDCIERDLEFATDDIEVGIQARMGIKTFATEAAARLALSRGACQHGRSLVGLPPLDTGATISVS